ITFSQIENVQLHHSVYTFLKEMKVKGIIQFIREDDPVISRFEVKYLLEKISSQESELSATEKKLLQKYSIEFSDIIDPGTSTQLFNPQNSLFSDLDQMFTDKIKYLYAYQEDDNNIYFEWLGHFYHGQKFLPENNINSNLYDIGFRIRGTVFNHLGYNLTAIKGGGSGNEPLAVVIEPRLLSSFKWIVNSENIRDFDFTYGYLKYHTSPMKNMNIALQVGREDITLGYGYGSKLILSGDNPTMDFLKFNFDYGIINFTSMHASTTGYFNFNREERYTKYVAFNRLKLKFDNLFDIGIGETMVYSGRGIELGYLTPLAFYKFIEMGIQDRDNGNIYFDLQTKFAKNLELQATFLLDENILSNLADLEKYTNKTAYQLGAFWYQPFSVNDLSLILEYTKIRPYVYTHFDIKNNYTAFGANLGHRIGPNADELMFESAYNFNDWLRISFEYRYAREGNNVYSDDGTLIKNVGGDIALTHGYENFDTKAYFLNGERVNTNFFSLGFRIEPMRDYIFDVSYNQVNKENINKGFSEELGYLLFKFTLEY
ncbi:MAG: capsule assembly Wzi family protein, partial [Ignavibacteria bacterium]|nr:capsule assembly Wzi family protein [Ignavibacteria bacterium]